MITTEAYFDNIREELIKELNLAQETIHVAVAWFTDDSLFQTLLKRQNEGVKVSLIIAEEEINLNTSINYEMLNSAGGYFKTIEGKLMHNKFCVIDKRVVITGSFNWTYKASSGNEENITITQGDFDLAFRFIQRFNVISGREEQTADSIDYSKIVKRISIMRDLIALGDEEDIVYQTNRLKKEKLDPEIDQIILLITKHQYDNALKAINSFINSKTTIAKYIDPRIAALQLEINALEFRIISFDESLSEKRRELRRLNTLYFTALGDILSFVLKERSKYYHKIKEKSKYHKKDYDDAKDQQEAFEDDKKLIEEQPSKKLDPEQEKNIKKLYKEAAVICHPDKVAEHLKDKANALFIELQQAYEQQDISKVAEIKARIESGNWEEQTKNQINDIDILIAKKNNLEQKLEEILKELKTIKNDEVFNELRHIQDIDDFLAKKRVELEEELEFWKEKNVDAKSTSAV